MMKPENSYEVAYVLKLKRPSIDVGCSLEQLCSVLGPKRTESLNKWAKYGANKEWIKNIRTLEKI